MREVPWVTLTAVRAFRRMNADPYALNPQEIRNAVFKDSDFLKATRRLAEAVDKLATGADHFLVEWGVMSPTQWDRMKDHQFISELLALRLHERPQEARRTLDDTYEEYFRPHGKKAARLKKAAEETENAIKAVLAILGTSLKPHGFDNENDLYCLIGALFARGIPTAPQIADPDLMADVRATVSLFRNQVLLCQEAIKENNEDELNRFQRDPNVKEYAGTLLGGQVNSAKRRQTRIDLLVNLINDRIATIDSKKPSDLQRRIIWAQSLEKKCARCGNIVTWEEYDCGHRDAKAFGGRAVTSNLRVEHKSCNRSAQAS
jgi:hypothetical protein